MSSRRSRPRNICDRTRSQETMVVVLVDRLGRRDEPPRRESWSPSEKGLGLQNQDGIGRGELESALGCVERAGLDRSYANAPDL